MESAVLLAKNEFQILEGARFIDADFSGEADGGLGTGLGQGLFAQPGVASNDDSDEFGD